MKKEACKGTLFTDKQLAALIFPLVVEQILAVSVGMVDTVMVSSVGEAATSGVALIDMINILFINVFAAVATGGAVVASQYLGQRRRDRACESADQLVYLTGAVSVVIMILCILFKRGVLNAIYKGVAPDVMQNAITYLVLSALSYPFLAVYNSCAALFRSMGNSKISMQASIIMNVINVIGDAVLIFVFHWGVAGAATASLISRMTACVILLLRLRNRSLDIYIGTSRHINKRMVKQILGIGIPNGIENSIFQLGRILTVSVIALFGTTQLAANAVANNLDGMGVIPGQAMSLAIISVIGRCVGAGDFKQAEYYAKKMLTIAYAVNVFCCAAVMLTLPLTMRLYGLSPEALSLASVLIIIHCSCAIVLWPMSFCMANVLRAANDVKFPMCASIVSMLVFRIGFCYVLALGFGMGVIGVWWAMIADWTVRSACFLWRYVSKKWETFYRAG